MLKIIGLSVWTARVNCYREIHGHGQWLGVVLNVVGLASVPQSRVTSLDKSRLNLRVTLGPAQSLISEVSSTAHSSRPLPALTLRGAGRGGGVEGAGRIYTVCPLLAEGKTLLVIDHLTPLGNFPLIPTLPLP